MKISRIAIVVLALSLVLGSKLAFAAPDEYDDSQSNPLRIVAYLLFIFWSAQLNRKRRFLATRLTHRSLPSRNPRTTTA